MEIKKLIAIPEMVRNNNDDGFCYPEKHQQQIYEWNDQYIYLKDVKYDSIPKLLFDELIKNCIPETTEYDVLSDTKITDYINKTIGEALSNSFININRVIDNINDRLGESIGLKDLQTFRENIEVSINALFNEKTQIAKDFNPEDVLIELQRLDKKIHDIKTTPIDPSNVMKLITEYVTNELKIVHDNLPNIINSILDTKPQSNQITEFTPSVLVADHKLSLGHLIALKEAGYTVQEIHELKTAGLV